MNLDVHPTVVKALETFRPLVEETADQVRYPDGYRRIPKLRQGYRYYEALARSMELEEPVLVRRGVLALPRRVELFAPVLLKDSLSVTEGATVAVEVTAELHVT